MATSRATGVVTCSCADAKSSGCVCKHVCFLAYRELQLEGVGFLGAQRLTRPELRAVTERLAFNIAWGGVGVFQMVDQFTQYGGWPTGRIFGRQ